MSLSSWTSLFFGSSFNEVYHISECWPIQRRSLFFSSQCSLRGMTFEIWVSFVSQIMFSFSASKRQLLMCLHPWANKWQLTSFHSWKIHHVLAFGHFLPQYQSWSHVCLSAADACMANREWGYHRSMSPCNNSGWKRDNLSYFHYSANSCLLL